LIVDEVSIQQFTPFDWRAKGGVNPSRQSSKICSSSAHFSFAQALETCLFAATNQLYKLSVQQIMDCHKSCSNFQPNNNYSYFFGGVQSDQTYPYEGGNVGKCRYNKALSTPKPVAFNFHMSLFRWDSYSSYVSMKKCPYVTIVGFLPPRQYTSGVYNPSDCSATSFYGIMTVLGYGIENGIDYWIVDNQNGSNWGEKGTLKLRRRDDLDNCGAISSSFIRPVFKIDS
jgi:hypothetical protein